MVLSLLKTQSWDIIKIQLFNVEPDKLTIDTVSTKLQSEATIMCAKRGLIILPYTSKRRTHANTKRDQARVHMWFAVMEAIQVIRLKNAPMTTKTTTRRRPSHNPNPPTPQSAISGTWVLVR
jgi:hypothetical protein